MLSFECINVSKSRKYIIVFLYFNQIYVKDIQPVLKKSIFLQEMHVIWRIGHTQITLTSDDVSAKSSQVSSASDTALPWTESWPHQYPWANGWLLSCYTSTGWTISLLSITTPPINLPGALECIIHSEQIAPTLNCH